MATVQYIFAILLAAFASYFGVLHMPQLIQQLSSDGIRWSVNVKDFPDLNIQEVCRTPVISPEPAAPTCEELFSDKSCESAVPLVASTLHVAAHLLENDIVDFISPSYSLQSILRNTFRELYQLEPENSRFSHPDHARVLAAQYMVFNASRILSRATQDAYILQTVLFNDGQLQLHATLRSWISRSHPGIKIVMKAIRDRPRGHKKNTFVDEVQVAASTWARYVSEHDTTCYSSFLTGEWPLYFRIIPTLRPMSLLYEQIYCFCEEKRSFSLAKNISS